MGETQDIQKLSEVAERLKQLNDKINQYDIPRTNFSAILEDEKILAVYHKEFSKVAKPLAYVRSLRKRFMQEYESNPQVAIENIKKRLNVLVNLIQLFSPNEILRLRRLSMILNRTEIDEIHKCMADANRWTNYALRNKEQPHRIDFFFNRLVVYLRGGFLDGVQFLGLHSYFRDRELADGLLKNEAIIRLRSYKKQMEFFRTAEAIVLEALKPGGRQELFWGAEKKDYKDGFYYNLRKGKKYISIVKYRFENEEFANFLERLDETIHAYPEKWEKELKILSKKLNDPDYQNTHVIYPATQELLALFQEAIDKISKSEVELKEIDSLLEKLEKDIKKRMGRLREQIAQLRKEFDKLDDPVADEMAVVMPALMDLMTKVGVVPERRLLNLNKKLDVYKAWLGTYEMFAKKSFQTPTTRIGAAFFAAVQSDKLAVVTRQLVDTPLVTPNFEKFVEQLEKRINTITVLKLRRTISFIREHDNLFTRPISITNELFPEIQESLSKLQNELIAEFKEEGIDLTKPLYG